MNPSFRYLPFIGRVLIAIIFVLSGLSKIGNPAGTQAYIAAAGLPLPELALWISVVIETLGGVLLIVGYQTRAVAAVVALFTLAAAFAFHTNFADQNQMIHFLKNICMTGGLLQVVAFGAGPFSLDARFGKA
ncbi:MAG: DoxX family protein [Bradyrhizobiaceae bacterium]|nr:MAG: DoxX family protein [Bradyrhizobiaceae bacterium]